MKKQLWTFFQFARLVDEKKQLSLTNIAVIIVLIKLATVKEAIQPVDVGALVGVLLNYGSKKFAPKE